MPSRIGVPQQLYAQPLIQGLDELSSVSLVEDSPARIAERYQSQQLECALLPLLEGLKQERCRVLPGLAVCFHGVSQSEWVCARCPLAEATRIAIAADAAAAGALARVLLAEVYGCMPDFVAFEPGDAESYDGVVVSGDMGLAYVAAYPYRLDLTEAWAEHTGLPFVHSLWFGRGAAPYPALRSVLSQALQRGIAELDAIAMAGAGAIDLGRDVIQEHMHERLSFRLGAAEMDAARLFLSKAAAHGMCAEDAEVVLC
jgi:chorismate dehydratase